MDCIEREKAISIIEEKQKELCPVGLYGRHYVYGTDREKYDAWDEIIDALNGIPASDVAPVVHGKWVNTNKEVEQMCKCSACGYPVSYFWSRTPYCPNCGAKMEEEPNK